MRLYFLPGGEKLYNNFENYELIRTEEISDVSGIGYVLRHKKSGAKLALISNNDKNKVFYIAFRTTPKDSTGVPHIIEHTVLCGSDKYPVKDPFIELAKSSLNTFLNAMTYPDKTIYPVASCNDQDIKNLMDVYMDAVLHPRIYSHEEIFKQEGWHYELEDVNGELKLNGVVYNEMKGAFSSADDVVDEDIMHSLFPDTTYGVCSGGDPEVIPSLTYEDYLDFHRFYYHPSNSYIYLYGNFDMEERLRWLDEEYLSKYDFQFVDSEVTLQKSFAEPKTIYKNYPIGADEDTKEKTYLSYNIMMGTDRPEVKKTVALGILDTILFGIPGAPVKQALQDAGIGKNILHSFNSYIRQPYFELTATFAEKSQLEDFVSITERELKKAAEEGVNRDSLVAALNSLEFTTREADTGNTPRGLIYGIGMLETWLYNDNEVFTNIKQLAVLKELREEIGSGYFEKLIKTEFIDNPHKVILISEPEPGLTDKKETALAEKLAKYLSECSAEEKEKLVDDTKALLAYQEEEDSEEDLAKLPVLKVSDVDRKALLPIYEERSIEGSKVVFSNIDTNGIAYIALYFALGDDKELLPYVSLFTDLIGSVDTENYSYLDLTNESGKYSGGIWTAVSAYNMPTKEESFVSYISLKLKSLTENIGKCFELGYEMLLSSLFTDKKRLKDVIGEIFASKQSKLISSGHNTAIDRAYSYFSERSAFEQMVGGIEYYEFIRDLYENFDEKADALIEKLDYVRDSVIRSGNILVNLTGQEKEYEALAISFADFKKKLEKDQKKAEEIVRPEIDFKVYLPEARNEAFKISGQIQYCASVGSYKKAGVEFTGAFAVLKTILAYDYLWMNVRVKGGAYGCFFSYEKISGNCGIVSYRDPNLKNTYKVYEEAADYIENLDLDKEAVEKYIIGTLSGTDLPKLPRAMGEYSFSAWLRSLSNESLQKERDEILDCSAEDIKKLAPVLRAVCQGYICTVGSAGKITEDADMFKEIKELN